MIKIICLGKIKESYLNDLINDYLKRISRYHKIQIIELKDDINILNESANIKKYLHNDDFIVSLDIFGQDMSSEEFADFINKTFIKYSTITFIIGSSLGLDESIKKISNLSISFSHLTFPHGLFRGILLEQIYRAFKIINNETYHK